MKKSLLIATTITLVSIGTAVAGELLATKIDFEGNERKGVYLYKKYCRDVCHDNVTAVERSPMDLKYADWEKLASNLSAIPCSKDWSPEITETDINDIFSYLHNGAADSPNPTK